MQLTIRLLRETDGRWIADIPELPGVTVYSSTPDQAILKAKALALRVIAEEIEQGEMQPAADSLQFSVAESQPYSRLLELRGKVRFSQTPSELKVDR
jgi:predicted RNase H-like HicB family nuclease